MAVKAVDFPMTEAIDEMIVYHSSRLHVRINDSRSDEAKSSFLQVVAERLGRGRRRRNLARIRPVVQLRPPVDKTPTTGIKVPKVSLDSEKCACVVHSSLYLHPIAYDPLIR